MAAGAEAPRLKLLLDEMWSPAIADQLRRRGHDVIAALDRDDLRGLSDEEVLELAATERRVIVTLDVGDFSRLAVQFRAEERDRRRVVLVSPRRFTTSADGFGALVRALDAVLKAHPGDDELTNAQVWLGEDRSSGI